MSIRVHTTKLTSYLETMVCSIVLNSEMLVTFFLLQFVGFF